jgi:hypothetical protein
MISDEAVARDNILPHDGERQKRLGQYFTGTALGRMLAAIARADVAKTIIDPMSGNGDLLSSCLEIGAQPRTIAGIEIDPAALHASEDRLPGTLHLLGSAFDPATLKRLPFTEWDLVITNPPYVRYQSIARTSGEHSDLPDAVEIRNDLLAAVGLMTALDDVDKELFRALIRGYSGFSDLAVPAWILCASLVAPNGRLALVVPESWLSRDYASVVQYILLRWFQIDYIIEDEHAAWFTNAQVKTTLIIAKRVPRKDSAFDALTDDIVTRVVVSGKATGLEGAFSRFEHGQLNRELLFADRLMTWRDAGSTYCDDLVRVFPISLSTIGQNFGSICARQKWFSAVGETEREELPNIPHELERWLRRSVNPYRPISLKSWGLNAGQGLRTGANSFFYCEKSSDDLTDLNQAGTAIRIHVPHQIALPAVRKQIDLPQGFVITPESTRGRVLDLRRHALPEDIVSGGQLAAAIYNPVPEPLANFIRLTASHNFGDSELFRHIWELTAVSPNRRSGNLDRGTPPRFWYMLPDFARRHLPDLIIPRVNSGNIKAYLNVNAGCIIDANFITIWQSDSSISPYAGLAFLNSAWAAAALEYTAAVMGGGALKVEATHLRRLPVPNLSTDENLHLERLGEALSIANNALATSQILDQIDEIIASAALGRRADPGDVQELRSIATEGRVRREKHKRKRQAP